MADAPQVQDLAIQALNLSLMFSVGLQLDPARLRAATRRSALLLGATALNFLAVPLVAVGVAAVAGLSEPVLAGVMLAAVAPGGGTGTLLTRAADGNLELSVVLLGIFTMLAVPLVPALMLGLMPDADLSLWPLLRTLLLFQLVPLAVGLALRLARPPLAATAQRVAKPLSNLIFGGLVIGLLITKGHLVPEVGPAGVVTLTLVVLVSLLLPAAWQGPPRDRAALSLTTGVRNLSLALLLSSTFFSSLTTLTVLTYGLVMYMAGVPVALIVRRRVATLARE